MSRILQCRPTAFAVLLLGLAALSACGGSDTVNNTITEVIPACSQSYPNGKCDSGQTCFNGACVASSSLCSPTNLTGTCGSGTTCLSGGCVLTSDLCSATNTSGLCAAGKACVAGACVVDASLCSPTNSAGSCPSGSTCFQGGCINSASLCSNTNTTGICAPGEVCSAGTCVDPTSACSPSNTSGTCPSGQTCLGGGCVLTTNLCSDQNTDGICDDGQVCFNGACASAQSLCSATNLSGICSPGQTCFSGGCIATDQLCSNSVPNGLCAVGNTCSGGTCVATGSLCSTSNLNGSCPFGQTCQGGLCAGAAIDPCTVQVNTVQPEIAIAQVQTSSTPATILTINGLKFKDLSKDGALQPYEDWRLSDICRAKDLVSRMTLNQKIGLMYESSTIGSGSATGDLSASVITLVVTNNVRQALDRISTQFTAAQTAKYMNNIQELAESQPLGIPFIVTADPSHGFSMNINAAGVMAMGGASSTGGTGNSSLNGLISQWPQPLGIGAINDPAIAKMAGDAIRRDYRGLGLRWELGPQADIATEPRWARVNNTFGENPVAVANMVVPFIQGMQGVGDGGLKGGGIASTLKHFPGAGADQQGMDSHSVSGRYNVFPGNNFLQHVYPFRAAVAAGAAAVMPCYSIFKNQWQYDPLQVGSVYSKEIITDLLKTELGFTGMISSDWGVISSKNYGLENASNAEKGAAFIKAGAHQQGQDNSTTSILLAYQAGLINDAELDGAVAKILEMSFKLGLFENPYTDYTTIAGNKTSWITDVNSVASRTNGFNAQKMAMVILRNRDHASGNAFLPIDPTRKSGTSTIDDTNGDGTITVYYDGIVDNIVGHSGTTTIDSLTDIFGDYDYTAAAGTSTEAIAATTDITTADIAVIRIVARKGAYMGLDAGVPLSFDAPFPGTSNDSELPLAKVSRNKVLDALRARDGYMKWDPIAATSTPIAATNPTLKIVLVMHMDRPAIVKPFINGLLKLDDDVVNHGTTSTPDYYPLVSNDANIYVPAAGSQITKGVDAFIVEFGAFDRAVLDVVFNKNKPTYLAPGQTAFHYGTARLPMEIPSTDAEVAAQYEDVPADTLTPSFKLGAGTTYTQ
ncbi:MAG: hypothetical protein JST92_24270 [Deltaproteobacteria bacterium]|nr:hypothetical protein [Deltaproteobacteria bacterium]